MALPKWPWLSATVFLADEAGDLIGTAFLIAIANYEWGTSRSGLYQSGPRFLYLVTAGHVVKGVGRVFATIRSEDGDIRKAPVEGPWLEHPTRSHETDVAVANFEMPEWAYSRIEPIHSRHLVRRRRSDPLVYGTDVYYAGLLTHVPSMGERMIPMVRAGKLGAWDQPGIPFRPGWMTDGEESMELRAHLMDCYGYYGFSGAPCFHQYQMAYDDEPPYWVTALLGVLVGFFDFRIQTEDGPVPELPVNAGVGIVAPAWDIEEILQREEFVKDREKRTAEHKAREDQKPKGPKVGPGRSAGTKKPGPDPERLQSDDTMEDLAKRVMEAGKPDDWDEEDVG